MPKEQPKKRQPATPRQTTRKVPAAKKAPPAESAATAGAVLHRSLTLVLTDDPMLYTELKSDAKVGRLLLAELASRAGAALPGNSETLIKSLVKAGHLPKVVDL